MKFVPEFVQEKLLDEFFRSKSGVIGTNFIFKGKNGRLENGGLLER